MKPTTTVEVSLCADPEDHSVGLHVKPETEGLSPTDIEEQDIFWKIVFLGLEELIKNEDFVGMVFKVGHATVEKEIGPKP